MKAPESTPWKFTAPVTDDSIIRCPWCKEMSLLQDWEIHDADYMACPCCISPVYSQHLAKITGAPGKAKTLEVCDDLFTDVSCDSGILTAQHVKSKTYFTAKLVSMSGVSEQTVDDLLRWLELKARQV